MNQAAATVLSSTSMDEDAWDDLLSFIEQRRVFPILVPELLQVGTVGGPRLLLDWGAENLAVRLNVNVRELPSPYTLNDVVCWFLAARGRREEASVRLRSILKEANFEPPAVLRQLAAALRAEAVQLLSGLAPQIARLHDTVQLRGWLNAEHKSG